MSDTIIVGAGLCGLAIADKLQTSRQDFLLLDARDRVGGRILTLPHGNSSFDMGPAWFWPGQPRISALTDRLGLRRFEQFATGALTFEDHTGAVQRGRGYASMEGSWRLDGGFGTLTGTLAAGLPEDRVRLNSQVIGLTQTADSVTVRTDETTFQARRVVLALPPRLIAGLTFDPPLTTTQSMTLEQIPTWMAGQAKAVAVYATPFWRDIGLSGDAMSRLGPMVEIHDASPDDCSFGALFGFIGVPPAARLDEAALQIQVLAQLGRMFGLEAAAPSALHIKDWATDPWTATPADTGAPTSHPDYGPPTVLQTFMDGRVIVSGTETAHGFGGFLEGALEAAEDALQVLQGKPA